MEKKVTKTKKIVTAYIYDQDEIFPAPGLNFSAHNIDDYESLAEISGLILQSKEQGEAMIEKYRDALMKMVSEMVDDARKELDECFSKD